MFTRIPLLSYLELCDHESMCCGITKTYLYNFDPLKPHFYIVKLGFTGVYIIFLISAQKHRLWVQVRTALANPLGEAVLMKTHNLCFEQKYKKISEFLSENFQLLVVKFSIYFNIFELECFHKGTHQKSLGKVLLINTHNIISWQNKKLQISKCY